MEQYYEHTITLKPPTDEQYRKQRQPIFSGKSVFIDRETGKIYASFNDIQEQILIDNLQDEKTND